MIKRIIIIGTIIKIMIIMTPAEKSYLGKCTILLVFHITYVQGFYAFWRTRIQNIQKEDRERFLVSIKIKPKTVKPFSTNYDSHFTQQGGAAGPGRQKTKKDSLSIFFDSQCTPLGGAPGPGRQKRLTRQNGVGVFRYIYYMIYIIYNQRQKIS